MPTLVDFLLANTKLRVIDAETCVHDGVRFAVALAVVSVDNGAVTETRSWRFNPQVPIDAASIAIHGITDADVAGCPSFTDQSAEIADVLTNSGAGDTIWVAHSATFDVRVLAREYARSNLTLPTVPVIDTYTLAGTVGQPTMNRVSLPNLADKLGIPGLQHHDPISDATTTASCLLALLRSAHTKGITDMPGLLAAHGNKTTVTLTAGMGDKDETISTQPVIQTPEHIAGHLTAVADNSTKSVKTWTKAFLECSRLGCEHARVLAGLVEFAPQKFLDKLAAALPDAQPNYLMLNTTLGALQTLVAEGGYPKGQVFTWHLKIIRPGLRTCPSDAASCPDCREGKPCPADVFYQSVGEVLSGRFRTGTVPDDVVDRYARSDKQIDSWIRRGGSKVAGFVIWACVEQAAANGDKGAGGKLRATVHKHRLDAVEPRLALQTATRLLADGNRGQADQLVRFMLSKSNTDPGYVALRDFQRTHLFMVPTPAPRVLKSGKPRTGVRVRRPAGRVETPRFKL